MPSTWPSSLETRRSDMEARRVAMLSQRLGWGSAHTPARKTEAGGWSGGVSVFVKGAQPQVLELPDVLKPHVKEGKLIIARVARDAL